jgi:hypothetical protein
MALILQGPNLRSEFQCGIHPHDTKPIPVFVASRPVVALELESVGRDDRDAFPPVWCFQNYPWLDRLSQQ